MSVFDFIFILLQLFIFIKHSKHEKAKNCILSYCACHCHELR